MDFGKGKFLRNDPLETGIVEWKTAYEVEKLMGVAVEFRKGPQNFTTALPVFSPNSSSKNLAVSVTGKLIRHEVPCWVLV
jgi:hypothetical protein